ncbi:batten disease protein Cln3 [Laetiporus sulphureus 93-53]|uniref:Protein BTN n=1 Tax=Laetiporus sulphureus 93-53 TaxID=1314785 RepID=A0A165F0Q6_9APHY|nr:batten disease protein Cln3 [Laetiporus sulphureus 93-53]KZT08122.1 batten disease protein Cln3 [Laetiporus sulphureus 93-53]
MDASAVHEGREEQTLLMRANEDVSSHKSTRKLLRQLGLSFFLFGIINNVLYVIILSAALDLVPPSTPKGIIAFCNIFPSIIAKLGWPYLLKGRIRYARRLIACCMLSMSGMLVVAMFDSLYMRLLGICFASFSSGLGELTFLQLSTRYHPSSAASHSIGYFASGTGAAGLVGALFWWELRSLGVRIGVGVSSVLPLTIPLTYFLLLPRPSSFTTTSAQVPYAPIPTEEALMDEGAQEEYVETAEEVEAFKYIVALSAKDKWRLVRPLVGRYMVPLFCVYLFEYTINQGIAPTLVYPVPSPTSHWLLSKIIHSIRDYYPLWQLVYQSTVFLSRSSISFGIPPLPSRLLPLPSIVQALILVTLALESSRGVFGGGFAREGDTEGRSVALIFALVCVEGVCGGLAYVNVYHHVNRETPPADAVGDPEREKQEREFKIGSIGLADSVGILCAALVAVPTELELCRVQVARGKVFCESL